MLEALAMILWALWEPIARLYAKLRHPDPELDPPRRQTILLLLVVLLPVMMVAGMDVLWLLLRLLWPRQV